MIALIRRTRRWFYAVLALFLLVSGIPLPYPAEAASDDKPLVLNGFDGYGTSMTNPVLYGDRVITLSGYFGSGVVGENLRIKITANGGKTINDLISTKPAINGNQFTFTDINLFSGLNQITFYERTGTVTKELVQFYVEYNDTPLLQDLAVNDRLLNNPAIDAAPTVIPIPSVNRLTLNMTGNAKNSEFVEVQNKRTGETIRAEVTRTGVFSLNLPALLGENALQIKAINQNKQVQIIDRTILVVTTSSEGSHQFYRVKLGNQQLDPNGVTDLTERPVTVGTPAQSVYTLTGSVLLRYADIPNNQKFNRFILKIQSTSDPTKVKSLVLSNTDDRFSRIANPSDCNNCVVSTLQGGFTEYRISADIVDTNPMTFFSHMETYRISLEFVYDTLDPASSLINVPHTEAVQHYLYEFRYIDDSLPRFGGATYKSSGQPVALPPQTNSAAVTPLAFSVQTYNMGVDGQAPDLAKFKVKYNGQVLEQNTEYSIGNAAADGKFDLTLKKLPAGDGLVEIEYSNPVHPDPAKRTATFSFLIRSQITPYVQISYIDSLNQVRMLNDGHMIQREQDIYPLSFKIFNYIIKNDRSNVKVTLNGTDLTAKMLNLDTEKGTFLVPKEALEYKKGNNVLELTLIDQPSAKYTYNISYFSSVLPEIYSVKLEIQGDNNRVTELTKGAAETEYQTEAAFLRSFSFTVKDAQKVYIEKNGKRIAAFSKAGSSWNQDKNDSEYLKARGDVVRNDDLGDLFDETNFAVKSDTSTTVNLEAKMTSRVYGDITAEVQDAGLSKDEERGLLEMFPLTLRENGNTIFTIVAQEVADGQEGATVRFEIVIKRNSVGWEILSPLKKNEKDPYIIVNSNQVPVRIFAENADQVLFGREEAVTRNTTDPDYYYDDDLGRTIPKTYYVFETMVTLKPGLNNIKYTVVKSGQKHNGELVLYYAAASVHGAEYRDILGKKTSFKAFDNRIELTFPKGTVLLSPPSNRAGDEVREPGSDIFVDVPLYFGIADTTTGEVSTPGSRMEPRLVIEPYFLYASPLYYIDAGDTDAPMGRDPYEEGTGIWNGKAYDMEPFIERYQDNLVPSKRGELTLTYDSSIVNAANTELAVFYHNGDEWRNLGGVVNAAKNQITVPFDGFGYYMVMKTRETFDDVLTHPFARNEMETLFAKGIMVNYSGNVFGANMDISRGEFATILAKALDLPINAGPYQDSSGRIPLEPTFMDVRPSKDTWDYQYQYIETAARAGIVKGIEPGYFRPDQPLTREQAAIMITRALNLKVAKTMEQAQKEVAKLYTDAASVENYAAQAVAAVSKAKLMNGKPNDATAKKPTYSFMPKAKLTRAEMAVIATKLMVQLKKLPK